MVTASLAELHVGRPTHAGGLSVFPVWLPGSPVRGLSGGGSVAVGERDGSPSVEELLVSNGGTRPALLLAGELFEGGWQHRALVHDAVLAPGSSAFLPVSCVEQGRWRGAGTQTRSGRRASLQVRSAQVRHLADRQSAVWERVSRYDDAFGGSSTGTLLHHLDGIATDPVAAPPLPEVLSGQRGVVVGIGGQPAFLEVFPDSRSLRRHLPALVAAAWLDAGLQRLEPTPGRRVRRFVDAIARAERGHGFSTLPGSHAVDAVAVQGHSGRLEAHGVAWQDQLAHLTVLNTRHELVLAA